MRFVWQGQEANWRLDSWAGGGSRWYHCRPMRSVEILSPWNDTDAVHPLAVHFCSEACRRTYEIYKQRGSADGFELDDRVQAEAEVTGFQKNAESSMTRDRRTGEAA